MDTSKDYILNIRVSKTTYDKLKQKAKVNSQSLSDLVRKSLDDSWEILTDLKSDLLGRTKPSHGIAYYQKIIVAEDMICNGCDNPIAKGSHAFVGETNSGVKKYFCRQCLVK